MAGRAQLTPDRQYQLEDALSELCLENDLHVSAQQVFGYMKANGHEGPLSRLAVKDHLKDLADTGRISREIVMGPYGEGIRYGPLG